MCAKKLELICIIFMTAALLPNASAGLLPWYTVDYMCDMADLIVEGTYLGKDKVKVEKVYKEPEGAKVQGQEIEVVGLGKHNRKIGRFGQKNTYEITAKNLFLFLNRTEDGKAWQSIGTVDKEGRCGSSGVKWFDETTLYHYVPFSMPGPFILVPANESEFTNMPKTIDDTRAEIKTGLENSKRWKEALAIADPKKKAEALSKYLLESTAPEGDKGTYRNEVREPLRKLGADAVPALMEVMKKATREDKNSMNIAVLIVYDIGPDARDALPQLYELLSSPERASTGYVLSALRSIGDPAAIPHIRPFLKNKEFAVEAAQALTALGVDCTKGQ